MFLKIIKRMILIILFTIALLGLGLLVKLPDMTNFQLLMYIFSIMTYAGIVEPVCYWVFKEN